MSVWLACGFIRYPDPLVVKGHVRLSIVEIVLKAPADKEPAIRGDCDISNIKETVDIGSEEQAVVETVLTSFGHRPYMSGIKDGQRLLASNGASALVVFCRQHPEGSLS
jgi:hypothetical protein